jgi:Ca-activated chloride channel family protein
MSFGSPLMLATLAVVPALVAMTILARRRAARFSIRFPNVDVLRTVAGRERSWRWLVPLAALLVALSAVGVALARPHVTLTVPSERATVVLVLDSSRSMESQDVLPSRLEAAKEAATSFVKRVPKRLRIGLVTFSGDVTVAATPTTDHDRVVRTIATVDPFSGFRGGTAIGDAIARAVEVGRQAVAEDAAPPPPDQLGRLVTILFLSDGRQNRGILPPLEGAALARDAGIRVFTVALGTENGVPQSGSQGSGGGGTFGGGGRRAPDPETLEAIARMTGGEFTWAQTAEEVGDAYRSLGSRLGRIPERTEVTAAFVAFAAVAVLGGALVAAWWTPRLP